MVVKEFKAIGRLFRVEAGVGTCRFWYRVLRLNRIDTDFDTWTVFEIGAFKLYLLVRIIKNK